MTKDKMKMVFIRKYNQYRERFFETTNRDYKDLLSERKLHLILIYL